MNYLEFKNYLETIEESEIILGVFKKDVEKSIKDKFLEAVFRAIQKYMTIINTYKRTHQISISIQTEEKAKFKNQEKVQSLLITERKSN